MSKETYYTLNQEFYWKIQDENWLESFKYVDEPLGDVLYGIRTTLVTELTFNLVLPKGPYIRT